MFKRRGFTLIEMLVVIAIISLLSSLVYIRFEKTLARNRDLKRIQDIQNIARALEQYHNDHGEYPASKAEWPGGTPPVDCNNSSTIPPGETACGTEESAVDDPGFFLEALAPYFPNGEIPVDPINEVCAADPNVCEGILDWWYHYQYRYNKIFWSPNNSHHWSNCGTSDHYILQTKLEEITPSDPEYIACTCPYPINCGIRTYAIADNPSTTGVDESACLVSDPVCGPEGSQAVGSYCCLSAKRYYWGPECNATVKGDMNGSAASVCGFGRNICYGTECD